jgi:hypothetical protein
MKNDRPPPTTHPHFTQTFMLQLRVEGGFQNLKENHKNGRIIL